MAFPIRTAEFRAVAIRIALTSGLPPRQVAAHLGVGFSTVNRWVLEDGRNPEKPIAKTDTERELAVLPRENTLLGE